MFIVNKKRLITIILTCIFTVSVLFIKNNNKSIETMSWSVPKKVIVLDAGHGLPDERSIK